MAASSIASPKPELQVLVRSRPTHDLRRLSTAWTLVTLVTACPDPSVRCIHHDASPTLTIARVSCLPPA